ncbi:ABC transporter ATP-binding protein [Kibdelosporangium aridum]|uniref:ABC transporter ATP-binding protein n=1 Tax=Kibdelosporangium aridum TaxID=2030 RepID=UPI000526F217
MVPEAGLEIDHVSKRYGDVVALSDMTFEVRPGELFGFVGSNGAGKTTTMRIALGVLEADSGAVRWAGEPITLSTRRRFGYMPEERGLYPKMKVLDQLVYLAKLHGLPSNAAHRAADDWIVRLGLRERRLDEVQKLSLGNQQRVQLAAALVHNPEVLVLDEPFSGLDPVAVDVMSQVLREKAAEGIPVVFSSHQLDLVQRLCDRVGIVNKGSMVACDTVDALRSSAASELVVHAPKAPTGWAAGIPGVEVVSEQDGRTTLRVPDDIDDQQILQAALDTGPVHEFSRHRPSLAELYRNVVKEGQ